MNTNRKTKGTTPQYLYKRFSALKKYFMTNGSIELQIWRLYSCTMKLRLSAMCVMRCPMCKKPTPIELEANGNSAWAPKLKKSFMLKMQIIHPCQTHHYQVAFTNPRIPVTYEIEVKKVLKALGYIDLQIRDYAESLKPNTGSPGPAKNMKVY